MHPLAALLVLWPLLHPAVAGPLPGCGISHWPTTRYVYFTESSSPNFHYLIQTPWMLAYAQELKGELARNGFTIEPGSPKPSFKNLSGICTWKFLGDVQAQLVFRGSIYYKDASTIMDLYGKPKDETVGRIEAVLLVTYPFIEILYIVFMSMVSLGLVVGFACWLYMEQHKKKILEKLRLHTIENYEMSTMARREEQRLRAWMNIDPLICNPREYPMPMPTPHLPRYEASNRDILIAASGSGPLGSAFVESGGSRSAGPNNVGGA